MTQQLFLRSALAALLLVSLGAQAQSAADTTPSPVSTAKPTALVALEAAEAALQKEPNKVEHRFHKAVLLSELGRDTEALELFRQLSQDLPAAPEPLNNLGVMYAKQGLLEEARTALRQAIDKDPRYATAYENLGDVHARLATTAYEKALQLEPNTATVEPKLRLVAQIVPPPANAAPTRALAANGAPAVATSAPVATAKVTATGIAPAAPPADTPAPKSAEVLAVEKAVQAWAKAWSSRDVTAYLSHYTADYAPSGSTRSDWEAQRRQRIEGKSNIVVHVEGLEVETNGQEASARFTQRYAANNHRATDRKTLHWVHGADGWKIRQESSR